MLIIKVLKIFNILSTNEIKMALFIPFPFTEEEERKRAEEIRKKARWSYKNAFEELQEELECDYLEDPCADNEELLYDVTQFLEDFEELEDATLRWMAQEYRLFFKKYEIRFY